ncbi:MAG: hypothetical protein NVSMB13_01220 [Mycobacteriales bacterium]
MRADRTSVLDRDLSPDLRSATIRSDGRVKVEEVTIAVGSRGLVVTADGGKAQLVDVRCRLCAACRIGRDYWCLDALAAGPVLAEMAAALDRALIWRWLSALAALAAARAEPNSPLLVLGQDSPEPILDLLAIWHRGPVVVATDARDPGMRNRLSGLSSTGRAAMVVTVTDVRSAVRAVERGGQVCAPDDGRALPSVTELVQRDVRLVSALSIDALVAPSSWAVLADRLSAVVGASTARDLLA